MSGDAKKREYTTHIMDQSRAAKRDCLVELNQSPDLGTRICEQRLTEREASLVAVIILSCLGDLLMEGV